MKKMKMLFVFSLFTFSFCKAIYARADQMGDADLDHSVLTRAFILERFDASPSDPQGFQNIQSEADVNCTLAFRDHELQGDGKFELKKTAIGLLEIKGTFDLNGHPNDGTFSAILGPRKDGFSSHDANITYWYSYRTTGPIFDYLACRTQSHGSDSQCSEDGYKNERIENAKIEARLDPSAAAIWLKINGGDVAGYCPLDSGAKLAANEKSAD